MRLLTPIKFPIGRLLLVLLYARYSTQEQDKSSIDDQILACQKFLASLGIINFDIVVLYDLELSGELANRPGIDQVRSGIGGRKWDLIVAEDSSRLFRNCAACLELVGSAVDQGIRVMLPGDDIDTADENWEQDLTDAQSHHCRTNNYTRKRIRRKHDGLWELGAAIGMVKTGYLRRPTQLATDREPAAGPYYDELDPRWQPIIYEAYERIARGDPPWLVGKWLTEAGLPKSANAKHEDWSDRNVIELIRRMVYKGTEVRRKYYAKKVYRSGKPKLVRNEHENIQRRRMEHMRIVPDDLWDSANAVIDARANCPNPPRGLDHPLAGIPRDSRGPLSNVFLCDACKEKMHALGRKFGGYRCQHVKSGKCWNRATSLRELTHAKIGERVVAELLSANGHLDALCKHIERLFENDQPLQKQIKDLSREIRDETEKRERLLDMFENASSESSFDNSQASQEHRAAKPLARQPSLIDGVATMPDSLLARLRQRDANIAQKNCELASLQRELGAARKLPSRAAIEQHIREQASRLLRMDREAGFVLQRLLDGPILAVPYQQFGSNKVVLRAEFKLRVIALLPDELFHLLERTNAAHGEFPVEIRTVVVDLFERTEVPKHARQAWEMRQANIRVRDICKQLKITKRIANQAVTLGKKMQEAGVSDPYVRLDGPPPAASRWGARKTARVKGKVGKEDGRSPGTLDVT